MKMPAMKNPRKEFLKIREVSFVSCNTVNNGTNYQNSARSKAEVQEVPHLQGRLHLFSNPQCDVLLVLPL